MRETGKETRSGTEWAETRGRVIALGFFDGVHRGHGALLRKTAERAEELGAAPAACTFDAHPEAVILGRPQPLLSTPADRGELMRRYYGIREVIVAHFDRRMMTMPWEAFVTDFLVGEQGARWLVAGHDYHFGYRGEGDPEKLRALCQRLGMGCDVIGKVTLDGITVSSTYIRTLVAQGEMERACLFLGHPHVLRGRVRHGKGLGSTLGFPTVNLTLEPSILTPAHGVYASKVYLPGGGCCLAATNIGIRPTVRDGDGVTVESFLLDFQGDLYGREVCLELYRRLRPERAFPSLEDLRQEVMKNAAETREYFEGTVEK